MISAGRLDLPFGATGDGAAWARAGAPPAVLPARPAAASGECPGTSVPVGLTVVAFKTSAPFETSAPNSRSVNGVHRGGCPYR